MGDAQPVEIDGGIMEGGGQILRVSTALSCLCGTPLHVKNIRAGRSQPGLRPQHLSGLEMVRDLCNGQMEGGEIGSTEVTFVPGKIQGGTHVADTKTAGYISVDSLGADVAIVIPCSREIVQNRMKENGSSIDKTPYWLKMPIGRVSSCCLSGRICLSLHAQVAVYRHYLLQVHTFRW